MSFLSALLQGGDVVEAVGNVLDKVFTSEEDKLEKANELAKAEMHHEEEMRSLDIKEREASLADLDSARDNQSRVQEAESASFLAKNVHPILALGILGLTFFMFFWIIQNGPVDQSMKDIIIYILGALTTITIQVVAYFFGSSQGSRDKQAHLEKLVK